ncbi:MAG: cytochrome c biogenesis protein CcsA [Candidatus Eisenbacteria bacterium]|uniref:Heme exporter protein C n=1 Tax=Eiseniibacteriota bacterium TaxID=2212470 RepID=A0A956LYE9_UNCEI|nr:cytochrome c biogenesis protein CcsA [Candidatus Eisenbacteria bacterium]
MSARTKTAFPFLRALDLLVIPMILVGLYFAYLYAPRETTMGDVQRIFYFHVGFALNCFLAFTVVFVSSIGFLWKGGRAWDDTALAAVEVGFLYCTLVLLTGPVWARSAWGVWWTWDARLTSTLLLWLIFASYLFLRTYMAEDPRMRRYAAALGILGALNVPIVYYSVKWFNTQHPTTFITQRGKLDPQMAVSLRFCMLAVLALAVALFLKRRAIGRLEEERDRLMAAYEEGEIR